MAGQGFEPRPTDWENFVLTSQPRPFMITFFKAHNLAKSGRIVFGKTRHFFGMVA